MSMVNNSIQAFQGLDDRQKVITIRTRVREADGDDPGHRSARSFYIAVEVIDNADGIPEEMEPNVWQIGVSSQGKDRGLGLPFVKSVAESHGGFASLTTSDTGTTVSFCLPRTWSVLVVDDDEMILEMFESVFASFGAQVLTASNAQDAIQLSTDNSPELILLDMGMIGRGGLALAKDIVEECEELWSHIVLMSGCEREDFREDELGGLPFISKPFEREELLGVVRNALLPQRDQQSVQVTVPG